VASDPNFDHVVWDVADIDMTQFTNPTNVLPDGVWYWRVAGIDESGNLLTWTANRTLTVDSSSPVFRLTDGSGLPVTANLHVAASESDIMGTVSQSTLHVVNVAGGVAVSGSWTKTSSSTWTFTPAGRLITGATYGLRTVGGLTDAAGNAAVASSHTVRMTTVADDKSVAWAFSSGWTSHAASNAIGGTYRSAASGHSASLHFVGSKVFFYGCKSPNFGSMKVYLDGHFITAPVEHQSFSQCGVLLWSVATSMTNVHTLTLITNGTASVDEVKVS
jgi:hypothetical protein